MKQKILVITDCVDIAADELYATLKTELEKMNADEMVEILPIVKIREFSIIDADFCARLLAEIYNPKTLTILTVANPLNTATKKRARIAGRLKNGIKFVGANTGAFTWLIKDFGLSELCETSRDGLKGKNFISFGGKYVHAPIAAKFAFTDDIESVKTAVFNKSDLTELVTEKGTVVYIDNFGVSKIKLLDSELRAKQGDVFKILLNDKIIDKATYCHSMKELSDGETAIYKGSSLGLVEIGIVRELQSAQKLSISVGDIIKLVKE
ncbi:MAG: SAM-dependent chlorinase/fluorinase [Candidatus Saccharibacteria bacterium]